MGGKQIMAVIDERKSRRERVIEAQERINITFGIFIHKSRHSLVESFQ